MRVPFQDLAAQASLLADELAAVLAEGWYVGGPRVAAFERDFAAYCGEGAICVGLGSGTDAIELGLRALGIGEGDEVITAGNTCVPTVAGIESAGATPVLVDPHPDTATIDPELLAGALTPRTRAIVPVHLYGRPAAMDRVARFAEEHGLLVLEDAAQAHGATFEGRRAGTLGHAAAFSFYPTKNLGALGDGGALVTKDREVADRARMLRSYGERDRYVSELPGRNSRLDTLQAAVLSVKLPGLDAENARRRELAALYRAELEGAGVVTPPDVPGHVYHLFVIRSERRDALRQALADDGVETLVHYPRAVHQHPAYAHVRHDRLRVSEQLAAQVLSLPLHPGLTDETVRSVAASVRRFA
jgi:dTDP-3-amino-3,4,6-trideoxy-alpha-D-glucose transaminase